MVGILDIQLVLKFQIFSSFRVSYKGLSDFSHLPKTGNYVITWRGVQNFNGKLKLVGEWEILTRYTKNQLSNASCFCINLGHTNIYK